MPPFADPAPAGHRPASPSPGGIAVPALDRAMRKRLRDPAPPSRLLRQWRDQPPTVERLHQAMALLGHPRLGVQCAAVITLRHWSLPAAFHELRRWFQALPADRRHLTEQAIAVEALCACAGRGELDWLIAQIPPAPISAVSRRLVWNLARGLAATIRRLGLWGMLAEIEQGILAGRPVPRDMVLPILCHARPPGWQRQLDALVQGTATREAATMERWRHFALELDAVDGPGERAGSWALRAGRLTRPRRLRPPEG